MVLSSHPTFRSLEREDRQGATVKAVIVGGYFEQEIEGIPPTSRSSTRAYFPSRNEGFFWGFDWNSPNAEDMVKRLNDMTGRLVSTFQGEEPGTSFVVDGTRGRNFAQTERKTGGPRRDIPRSSRNPRRTH